MKGKIWKFLLIAIAIGVLVNIFVPMIFGFKDFHRILFSLPPTLLLFPFLCYVLGYLIDSIRLKIVAGVFGYKTTLMDGFTNSVYGYLFSYLTPMAAGGQPFQIWHLSQLGLFTEDATNIVLSRFVEYTLTSVSITLISYKMLISVIKENLISVTLIKIGLVISVGAAALFLFLLVRPDSLGKLLHKMEKSPFGRFIARLTRKDDWGERVYKWTLYMKESVDHFWRKNMVAAIMDTILGFSILALQSYSLFYVLRHVSPVLGFWKVLAIFSFLNLIVYYIPTPGASGSVEAAYSLVFSAFIGYPQKVFAVIAAWRASTYYFHILFELIWLWAFGRVRQESSNSDA